MKHTPLALLIFTFGCGSAAVPIVAIDPQPSCPAEEPASELAAAVPDAPDQVDASFAFPQDGVGKQLAERLTPPRQSPLPPVPFVMSPLPRRDSKLDRPHETSLPPLELSQTPRLLPSEKAKTLKSRPVVDEPPLVADPTPVLPAPVWFVEGPRVFAPTPDAVGLSPNGPAGIELPNVASDPTLEQSRLSILSGPTPMRDQPAPAVNLAAADPFALQRLVRLRTSPAENDEPANSTQRPPLPALPVK
jgi:hypothetical protein